VTKEQRARKTYAQRTESHEGQTTAQPREKIGLLLFRSENALPSPLLKTIFKYRPNPASGERRHDQKNKQKRQNKRYTHLYTQRNPQEKRTETAYSHQDM
jgi:hypothetical protein